MKFKCHDYFMVRTPSLSLKYLEEYNNQEKDIYEFIRSNEILDEFFKKALLISSKTLYSSYINKPNNIKKYNNLKESLLKYFVRSTTRATPYGYFSSVSIGEFSSETNLVKNKNLIDLKIDNKWINYIVYILEREEIIFRKLKFQCNKICYRSGNRFKNPYFTNYGKVDLKEKIVRENNIKYTHLIELIKNKTNKFVTYNDLEKVILKEYENVPKELVEKTIKMLLENEYLLSNLRIPSYCSNNLNHIIEVLEEINYKGEYLGQLKLIDTLILEYKGKENIKNLENIYNSMSKIYENKNYLILNLGNEFKYKNLSKDIKIKIEKMANLLYEMPIKLNSIDKFKGKFIEEYGMNIEVPLTKIIDTNDFNGLSLLNTNSNIITKNEKKVNDIINTKIFQAILNGEDEVTFIKRDFEGIDKNKQEYLKSFDINILITELDNEYNLYLGPSMGSNKAGAMFQRFSDCFNKDVFKKYNEIYKKEEDMYKNEYLLVEAREMSISGKSNNVINNSKNYKYFLPFGNCYREYDKEITIDDIYIGVSSSGNIYIKSKKYNKKIKIITDNMLNLDLNNNILKLLKYICETYEDFPEGRLSSFMSSSYYKYIPRINFEGIIVSPRKWILDDIDIKAANYEEFKKQLNLNRKRYKIDNVLYQCVFDNRIIVNLDRDEYVKILYTEYRKSKKLEFNEIEKGLLDGSFVKDFKNNRYTNEFVFSLITDNNKINEKSMNLTNNIILNKENKKLLLCEEGWVYFKLYGISDRDNELLSVFLEQLLKDLDNTDHFFLRYKDDIGYHLRIRIKFENEKIANEKLSIINQWIRNMIDEKVINNVIFDTYQKEINRYGGEEIIELCEKVFFKNSITVESILKKYDLTVNSNIEKMYIFGIVSILKNLTADSNEMFLVLDSQKFENTYRDEYRKKRKEYINFIQDLLDEKKEIYIDIYSEFIEEKIVLNKFKKALDKQVLNNKNTNSKESILLSIIHMYCNRLTGNLKYEEKYLEIVRNSLYNIIKINNVRKNM
ncbi:thiopeptide-type bacteriocin biosynthesis protein [Clostridioides difficile]